MGRGIFDRVEGELAARERSPGLSMSDLLTLSEPQGGLLKWMIRQGQVSLADVGVFLGQDEEQTRSVLDELCQQAFVREIEVRGVTHYRVRLAPKRGRELPANLWQALSDKVEGEEEERP
jgi:hypothetical protein